MGTRQNRTRKNRIEFYLDDREYSKFRKAVEKSGLNISTYLRHLAKNLVPQDRPPMEYWDLLEEMRAIKLRINRIADIADISGVIDADKYHENCNTLRELYLKIFKATIAPRKAVD